MHLTPVFSILVLSVAACAGPSAPLAARTVTGAHADAVERLVGVWLGKGDTPMGEIPIALVFEREPDGAVHARLPGPGGMYLDFRFHRDGDRWLLTEEGYLPGNGTQRHVLVPLAPGATWVDRDDASALAVTIEIDERSLVFSTRLHGDDHAAFRLRRVAGDEAEGVRRALATNAGVSSR